MRYPKYKNSNKKKIAVKSMNGGVNLREKPFNIDDGQCSEMHNMWFTQGALKTRPGIRMDTKNIICDYETRYALFNKVTFFDLDITEVSKPCRLALCYENTMYSMHLKFYLVYADGTTKSAGSIDYRRAAPHAFFYIPHVCSAFYNSSSTGSGIYIMLSMCNYETEERGTHIRFYELGNDLTTWSNVTDSKMYVPTIYINGRGNNYGAVMAEPVPSFPPAAFCESPNMLTGKFRAFYGTDGLSHTFRLPVQGLTAGIEEYIQCKLRILDNEYVWFIGPDNDFSNTVEVMGKNYAVQVDREEGKIMFVNPSNFSSNPLPLTTLLGNNLEITAYKSDAVPLEILNTTSVFCEYSSRLFLSGASAEPNSVYFSAQSNPFYFPAENKLKLGSQSGKITALAKQGKLLIAFKAEECHSIDSKNVGEYDIDSVIQGITKMPQKTSDVRVDVLSSEVGCDCPATLINCANRLVWLNSRGVIYTIIASNQYSKGNVYELSLNIEPYLKSCDKESMYSAFAVLHGGYYIVFIGNNAVVMDYTIKGFRYVASCSDQKQTSRSIYWYLWQLPEEIKCLAGITVNGEAVIACYHETYESLWYAIATLSGEEDYMLFGEYGSYSLVKSEISCGFKTKSFDFDSMSVKKFLDTAYLSIGNKKPITLKVFDGDDCKAKAVIPANPNGEAQMKSVRLCNTALTHCAMDFECNGYTEFCGFELYGGI